MAYWIGLKLFLNNCEVSRFYVRFVVNMESLGAVCLVRLYVSTDTYNPEYYNKGMYI